MASSPGPNIPKLEVIEGARKKPGVARVMTTPTRRRILEAAANETPTRDIARNTCAPEAEVRAVIADEVEFAERVSARLEVCFLPAVARALRETLREAREDCRERKISA